MKKYCSVIGVLMVVLLISGCSAESNQAYMEKQLNIELPDSLGIEHEDDHGGFHGDGERFAKIKFDKVNGLDFLSQIEQNSEWNKMPLSENLTLIMYGGNRNNIDYAYNLAEEAGIPEIKNGYWYFTDRHSHSTDRKDTTELLDRYSLNFTLAMYDENDNILYFYELDT